ncbi:MAG: CBS domain-containing protein [Dehalococcoidia bacterium]|nr:CBS domain-containing protein [Chloroflexota bacterium]MXW25353.1 CBS domain-containing protein [Dehalococcoidia bacterium]MXY87608.1 CBS domain-containing protein [Dehalococcoidia bacterium]MXZ87383.1 CBS domain-containing protein [Dehalococcoidia bacterium]MYA53878.1 CBS domain-containing protein [Dehalococcoidia bacterium]
MNEQGHDTTIRVSDLMGSQVHTIDGLATAAEAMATMKRLEVSSLVVNRRHDDDELGVITVTDLAREVITRDRAPDRVNVYEIMSKPALTVRSGMLARYAARLLVRFGVSRALVVDDDGAPRGLVTLRDLVLGLTPE